MRNPLGERSRLLKPANPVRETLAKSQLDAAHALRPADERERAIDTIDHAGGLDCSDHAGGASHDGGEGGRGRRDARVHQHFARDVAPRKAGNDRAPDREVRRAPAQLGDHVAHDRQRKLDGVELAERAVNFGERCSHARGKPDLGTALRTLGHGEFPCFDPVPSACEVLPASCSASSTQPPPMALYRFAYDLEELGLDRRRTQARR